VGRLPGGYVCRIATYAAVLLLHVWEFSLCAEEYESFRFESASASGPSCTYENFEPSCEIAPTHSWNGDLCTRSQLTGDWAGLRTHCAERGVTFFGDITQYYQGVTTGGLGRQFEYGGRGDYLIDLDSQKLGLWEGGSFDLRGETRLGEDCNQLDGVVAPSNFALALPLPNRNVTALTGVQYTQALSDRVSVFCGKLNLLDGTPTAYNRGLRLNYFWNAAMQSNLCRSYLIPSSLGTGFTIHDDAEPVFNFYLLDTHYTPTTTGLSSLFSNGVVVYGDSRVRTNWLGRPGHSAVGLLYSSATRTALDTDPYLFLAAALAGAPLPQKSSAWTATYRFDQELYADPKNPQRHWTLNGDFGLTDGNPNPIRWFANATLIGSSPIRARENDTIGLGYYHLGVSNLPILSIHGIGAEDGVEMFYNVAVTPWFHLTPDLQVLDPAQRNNATTILVGARARMSF
jgi:porin